LSLNGYHITDRLFTSGVLKRYMSTSEAVKFLNDKKYHRKKITKAEYIEMLGRKRKGSSKKHFEFSTIKLIQFLSEMKK
jgi:uncharacterized protein (DUF2132 family)